MATLSALGLPPLAVATGFVRAMVLFAIELRSAVREGRSSNPRGGRPRVDRIRSRRICKSLSGYGACRCTSYTVATRVYKPPSHAFPLSALVRDSAHCRTFSLTHTEYTVCGDDVIALGLSMNIAMTTTAEMECPYLAFLARDLRSWSEMLLYIF